MCSYFPAAFLLLLILAQNEFLYCFAEKRVSQEEWQQFRFGGLPMASDPNQWVFNGMPGMPNMEMGGQIIQSSNGHENGGSAPTLETNIQDVEVGKDKLVLVNDQGTIKMLRASQLPTMTKQNTDVTTQTPNTVIQMPLEQYLSKDSNSNPTKNPNQMEIISSNYGAGHRVQGLPVAFATSSNQPDRPNVIYQTDNSNNNNNPCLKSSDNPPIYIPAPQFTTTSSRSSDKNTDNNRKMVRIIIEMPESMTKNIDEASRYAATQVQRLKTDELPSDKPRRKIKKNVQEVIRKVVQTEEDNEDSEDLSTHASDGRAEDMDEELNHRNENSDMIYTKTAENNDNNNKQYIILRKNGRPRGSAGQGLRAIDKYKKIIRVYRE